MKAAPLETVLKLLRGWHEWWPWREAARPHVDTITTRFLLLFLFLLAIPLMTVIIFTVSLLVGFMEESANSQLALSKNLMDAALVEVQSDLAMLEGVGQTEGEQPQPVQLSGGARQKACNALRPVRCIVINPLRQQVSLLPDGPRPLASFLQQNVDLAQAYQLKNDVKHYWGRVNHTLYALQPGQNKAVPLGSVFFWGYPIDSALLNRIYRQQPNLQTEIWIVQEAEEGVPPRLLTRQGKTYSAVFEQEILASLQSLALQTVQPVTLVWHKNEYRILQDGLYGPDNRRIARVVYILPLTKQQMLLSNYYVGIYFIAVASLIFSVLLAMVAGRTITQPLLKLIFQVNTLSRENVMREGDGVTVGGVYEIQQLGEAFNRMIKRLRQEHKMKDEFVATLTHDLKVPLLAEKQTLTYFSQQAYGPLSVEQSDVLDILRSSNRSCLSLVNGLLEVYRYDSGEVALVFEVFNLLQLLRETVGELQSLAQEKSIGLQVQACLAGNEAEAALVYADPLEIKRVLHNLISNAILNTPVHGKIQCSVTNPQYFGNETLYKVSAFQYTSLQYPLNFSDRILVSIQDSGIGFAHEDLPFLFKQFAASRGRNPMSIGLGLHNCYQVLQAHNSMLWVESTEGEGSVVSFLLSRNLETAQDRRVFRDRRRFS